LSVCPFHAGDFSPSFRYAERLEVTVARLLFAFSRLRLNQPAGGRKQKRKKQLDFPIPADAELKAFHYLRGKFIKNSQHKIPR
jgi:hypothetical protein